MPERRLITTTRSPFARKVSVALLEKGIAFQPVNVDLAKKPLELLHAGPIQKVPVLIDQGLTLNDSTVICEYLEERYPTPALYPHGYLQRAKARMWEEAADTACESAIKVFSDRTKPASLQDAAGVAKAEGLLNRILDSAESALRDRNFLAANTFTIADIAFVSAIGYVEFRLGTGWKTARPNLVRYFGEHSKRASFKATIPVG
jgi:glutathione S-transferase